MKKTPGATGVGRAGMGRALALTFPASPTPAAPAKRRDWMRNPSSDNQIAQRGATLLGGRVPWYPGRNHTNGLG